MKISQRVLFSVMGLSVLAMWIALYARIWAHGGVPWWNRPLFLTGSITGGLAFGLLLTLKGEK